MSFGRALSEPYALHARSVAGWLAGLYSGRVTWICLYYTFVALPMRYFLTCRCHLGSSSLGGSDRNATLIRSCLPVQVRHIFHFCSSSENFLHVKYGSPFTEYLRQRSAICGPRVASAPRNVLKRLIILFGN
jgi:hypothetical protein